MKNLGNISDPKDVITKEYLEGAINEMPDTSKMAVWANVETEEIASPTEQIDADLLGGYPPSYYLSTLTDDVTGNVFQLVVSDGKLYIEQIS